MNILKVGVVIFPSLLRKVDRILGDGIKKACGEK